MSSLCLACGNALTGSVWGFDGLARCSSCLLLQRARCPSQEELDAVYATSWRNPIEAVHETGGINPSLAASYVRFLRRDLGADLSRRRILDFGAGRGDMAQALLDAGADVVAVEPYGVDFLRWRGIEALSHIEQCRPDQLFDGVVMLDVLEHLRDPTGVLERLRGLTVPGGWIYISTPNAGGLKARILRSRWSEVRKFVHLSFFDLPALRSTLERAGYCDLQRLKWFVKFQGWPGKATFHHALQVLGTDGVLRVLARRS